MGIYWELFVTYLKIGLFNFGGGYAMLPLIKQEVVDNHAWLSNTQFTDIVAISQVTPGPIGINSATYIGYTVTGDILGAVVATVAVCIPSFVIILTFSILWGKFKESKYLQAMFLGLRPVVVGLIAAAALLLSNDQNFIDYKSFLIFGAAFALTFWAKLNPIPVTIIAGVLGLLMYGI